MDLDRALLTEAVVGHQAQEFLEGDVGQALLAKAELIAADAMRELKTVPASMEGTIRELQNKIWLAESFENWLVELIQDGRQATQQLQQQQRDEQEMS